jgi:hypothetical protein
MGTDKFKECYPPSVRSVQSVVKENGPNPNHLSDASTTVDFAESSSDPADITRMDVTTVAGATAFQQQKLQANVQTSVDAKTLNIAKNLGAGALQLLQGATKGFTAPQATAGDSDGDTDASGLDTYA